MYIKLTTFFLDSGEVHK